MPMQEHAELSLAALEQADKYEGIAGRAPSIYRLFERACTTMVVGIITVVTVVTVVPVEKTVVVVDVIVEDVW
jgi:hypothetical protein